MYIFQVIIWTKYVFTKKAYERYVNSRINLPDLKAHTFITNNP